MNRPLEPRTYGPECPHVVERVAMFHRWERLTFIHWGYDVDVVQRLLPPGLTVEPYHGLAWVGLAPFFMEVTLPNLRRSGPWVGFPETNVRTYVRGPAGESGVWFFSLDASRLGGVLGARLTYRQRYFWSKMSVSQQGDTVRYSMDRRWPGPRGAQSRATVEVHEPYRPDELTEFDHFLTARFVMYGAWKRKLLLARAQHGPWPLHRARIESCTDELVAAAGLPEPTDTPLVHWSPGVEVRIGFPTRVRGGSPRP